MSGRRALLGVAVAAAALAAPPATGHPGHGPSTVGIAQHGYSPRSLTVAKGDTVIWFWNGPDTNHSVTSKSGQSERFDSDPDTPAVLVHHKVNDAYSHRFDELGTFRYYCKVHPDEMKGTIEVQKAPPRDVTPPRISRLRVTPRPATTIAGIRFRISEGAFVVATIRQVSSKRDVRTKARFVSRGPNRISVRVARLPAGRYRAILVAEDNAANRTPPTSVGFRVA